MKSITTLIVRYVETDQMGVVHHSNYPIWFEAGRMEFIKNIGISNKEIEQEGIILPLINLQCSYKSPAFCEDKIEIYTKIKKFSKVRLDFEYEVFNSISKALLAAGETQHVWANKSMKPINLQKANPILYNMLINTMLD